MNQSIRTRVVAAAALLISGATPAIASSDKAWAVFHNQVTHACTAASGIRNARPSKIVGFDDRVGKVALLVSDRTRGSSMSKLCLYDKRTKKAFVDDAEMWSAPPQR